MLKHPLYDAAAELMHTHLIDTTPEGLNNELNLLRRDLFDNLLYHVIAIRVLDTSYDVRLDFFNDFIY